MNTDGMKAVNLNNKEENTMQEKFGRKLRIMLLTVAALALACGNALAGWTFTDLNAMGGLEGSYALGINNNGDIVGQASFAGATSATAAIWSNGVVSNLGTLGGNTSSASDINDYGVVVGKSYTVANNLLQAFKWDSSNGMQALPTLSENGSGAAAINNAGQIVGSANNDLDQLRPVLWDSTGIHVQSALSGVALGINKSGQIVGMTRNAGADHAMLWSNGEGQDLGTFGGSGGSTAKAINDNGQVSILTRFGTNTYNAIWSNGVLQDWLPDLGSGSADVSGMNNAGQLVGSMGMGGSSLHAILWQDGAIIDLNSLVEGTGWTLLCATDINDKGQIVGYGTNGSGYSAFLLTPDATPTPIPATLPLFGSALAALGVFRRRFLRA
jgi:probable HAF family extracellular repeat protein